MIKSTIREMYKDELSENDLYFVMNHKHKGKTADEWLHEVNTLSGFDEDGNPAWYVPMSNATDTVILAKAILLGDGEPRSWAKVAGLSAGKLKK